MNAVEYRTGTATEEMLLHHLRACDDGFSPPLSSRVNLADYARKIFTNAVCFEAWAGDQLAGLLAVYCNAPKDRPAFITHVSVLKEFGGMGVADGLLKRTIDHASESGCESIALEVAVGNSKAVALYERNGFHRDGHITDNTIRMIRSNVLKPL